MQDDLLHQYQHELFALKQNLNQFACTHPHLIEFLNHNGEEINDPFINQLLEGIAFLNSRTGIQLKDSLNVLSNAVLELLAPDFLAPLPSMTILQLIPQATLKSIIKLPAELILETDSMSGYNCYFKTCYPIELIPARVSNVFSNHDLPLLDSNYTANIAIQFQCLDPEQKFSTLTPKKIRLYLHGKRNVIETLYHYLFEHIQAISLTSFENSNQHIKLTSSALKAVGFAPEETLLPTKTDHHLRLLTEYFCFRDKFWFIDIEIPTTEVWQYMTSEILLTWHFNRALPIELQNLTSDNFVLNAAPIINLFPHTAQTIHIDNYSLEYPIIINEQEKNQVTLYQITQVAETDAHNNTQLIPKFYSIEALQTSSNKRWWTTASLDIHSKEHHSIALVDEQGQPSTEETILTVSSLCCNGQLPHQLAINNQLPMLKFTKPPAPIIHYKLLMIPSPMQRLFTNPHRQKSLLIQVLLKHIDLNDGKAVKLWLDLIFDCYGVLTNKQATHLPRAIKSLSSKQVLGRLPHLAHNQLCYGTELTIEITNDSSETLFYLFAKVLDQCLVEYSSLNSFNQLKISKQSGVIKLWPRRSRTSFLY